MQRQRHCAAPLWHPGLHKRWRRTRSRTAPGNRRRPLL